jgi:hypothetical protein
MQNDSGILKLDLVALMIWLGVEGNFFVNPFSVTLLIEQNKKNLFFLFFNMRVLNERTVCAQTVGWCTAQMLCAGWGILNTV